MITSTGSSISPSTLQSFNNELIKSLEQLRNQRSLVAKELVNEQEEAGKLESQLKEIQQNITQAHERISEKKKMKLDLDRLISVKEFVER